MRDGFKVIDADRHVLEPSDLYQRYLPERFKNRVRLAGPNQTVREVDGKPVSDSAQRPGRVMEDYGYIFSSSKRWRECFADAYEHKFDPASNIRDMDREGIDVSVLFPTPARWTSAGGRSRRDPRAVAHSRRAARVSRRARCTRCRCRRERRGGRSAS